MIFVFACSPCKRATNKLNKAHKELILKCGVDEVINRLDTVYLDFNKSDTSNIDTSTLNDVLIKYVPKEVFVNVYKSINIPLSIIDTLGIRSMAEVVGGRLNHTLDTKDAKIALKYVKTVAPCPKSKIPYKEMFILTLIILILSLLLKRK